MENNPYSLTTLINKGRYAECIEILKRLEKKSASVTLFSYLARFHLYLGQYEQAEHYALKQLSILNKQHLKDTRAYLTALNHHTWALCGNGEYDRSSEYTIKCLELVRKLNLEKSLEYAQVFTIAANVGVSHAVYQTALEGYQRALEILDVLNGGGDEYIETLGSALLGMAFCHEQLGQKDSALLWYEESAKRMEKLGGKKHPKYASALFTLGSFYVNNLNNAPVAMHMLTKALFVYDKTYGMDHFLTQRLTQEMLHVLRMIDSTKCSYCKKSINMCTQWCLQQRWAVRRKDSLQCQCCKDWFSMLNISKWGVLYCDDSKCKDHFL